MPLNLSQDEAQLLIESILGIMDKRVGIGWKTANNELDAAEIIQKAHDEQYAQAMEILTGTAKR